MVQKIWTIVFLLLAAGIGLQATETENLNINVLPAKKPIKVDGDIEDWDLSGGVLICSDVENLRTRMGTWIHVMYDAKNLYVLSRWLDETPMSHPGSIAGDFGWSGDSLQLRIIAGDKVNNQDMICWVTAWRDRDGKDVVDLDFPRKQLKHIKDAKTKGAQQAFKVTADGKGYIQEIALPWSVLTPKPFVPKAGGRIKFSVEPNFNTSSNFRISMKGIFQPGEVPDRVFTFSSVRTWGFGMLQAKGNIEPQKLRLADRREFNVSMQDGKPVVDWTGLFKSKKMEGFVKIPLVMPEDGYVSLNIKNAKGQVVRQLLTANFYTKGKHEIVWDGLTNMSHLKPGEVVPAGKYTWEAIYHTGLGLRMVGWADNAGKSPFNSPGGNWGGDHGKPCAVTTNGKYMFLGWSGSEAGKAVVCTDLKGNVKWRHKRGGFGSARHIAADAKNVYVNDTQLKKSILYRLDAKNGSYAYWKGKQTAELQLPSGLNGMDIAGGRLYLAMQDAIHVLDAETGKEELVVQLKGAGDVEAAADGKVYVLVGGAALHRLADKGSKAIITGLKAAKGLAIDKAGNFYIGLGAPANQVAVFDAKGKEVRRIGKKGGRPLTGLWDPNGLRFIYELRVDKKGKLWVAEQDDRPKRFSCWNTTNGKFVKEFFGPTVYGALGGAISPLDPLVMVGSGCEWKLDKETGRATCVAVFHRGRMQTARFGLSPKGRQYVAVGEGWIHGRPPVSIYERLGAGKYKLRTRITELKFDTGKKGRRNKPVMGTGARVWADANDDQKEQPGEVQEYKVNLNGWIAGWGMPMTQTMIFYGTTYRATPTGWTACGAPQYDFSKAKKLPISKACGGGGMGTTRGCGSQDGKLMVYNGWYGKDHALFTCFDIDSGKEVWTYPNNYVGVHGGHRAPPAQTGLIRGAYTIVGTGKMREPIGDIFVISTDKGEWHILTGDGYYLSSLFQSSALKRQWPGSAVPGAIMDNCPPGMGAEDFGGSITVAKDGNLYVQSGKTAFVNAKVVGLDSVKKIPGGKLTIAPKDLAEAKRIREKLLQASVGTKRLQVMKKTVTFTGNLRKDFSGSKPARFAKDDSAAVQASLAYDDRNLYLGYYVKDQTPWVNGASDPAQMYAMGDTVDFQIGTDRKANGKGGPSLGDLRLSVGNCQGKNVAVVYRPKAKPGEQAPKTFYSGVVRQGYKMESVKVLKDAKINVTIGKDKKSVTVEVAVPLRSLGLKPKTGLKLPGDIGVTHGDAAGKDTILRTYWNNQKTGLVADEVFELKLTPGDWGIFTF